jgi:DNA modification methylase
VQITQVPRVGAPPLARLKIESYADLLQARSLAEWRFIGDAEVETEWHHLASTGMVDSVPGAELGEPSDFLFDYQRWLVEMACERERFAVFADCGLGKTPIQLDWARLVTAHHHGRTLIVAPLQVVPQTIAEAQKFYGDALTVVDLSNRADFDRWLEDGTGIGITNYEKLDDATGPIGVQAVVLDESSVLKSSMGSRRTAVIAAFRGVRWKLCCTATPAPNDRVEYAEHAYFLDVVRSTREFLAAFFVNRDGSWQLKTHGVDAFYHHLASWSVFMRSPSAYGFADNLRALPPMECLYPSVSLTTEQMEAAREWEAGDQASLFGATPAGITSRTKMMQIAHGFELDGTNVRLMPSRKPTDIARLVNETHGDEQVIVWVTFDHEADQLAALIPDAVAISGKTKMADRASTIESFRSGDTCRCPSQSRNVSTTVATTRPTSPIGGSALPRSRPGTTPTAEPPTPLTQPDSWLPGHKSHSGGRTTQVSSLPSGSSRTASPQPITSDSLMLKAEPAPSATDPPEVGAIGFTSTMTTLPVESVDSCAVNATSCSGSSGMIRFDSRGLCITCGKGPRVLLCKASMLGFGLNLQACRVQVFSTITDSYERFYQAVRRSYRYGQERAVVVYIPLTPLDQAMCTNVLAKQAVWEEDAQRQEAAYVAVLRPRDSTERIVRVTAPQAMLDRSDGENWTVVHGDCIAHMPTMADDSMDLAVFSPPFANLFTYSSSLADMGNVRADAEYRLQWKYFGEELLRVMKPGRVVAIHCMEVIRFAGQHGHRYTYDYPADLRAGMESAGFRYHARISIDKNPQVQAVRTKDANLLFATLKRNALDSHPQAAEFVLIFRKPGEAAVPVIADVDNADWIRWAHHIWYGIAEGAVLNAALGKEHDDERHICPLQLPLIERIVRLWTNPREVVFSPFAGIGSEGFVSVQWDRRFYGVELKESYYRTACRFLAEAEAKKMTTLPFEAPAVG